MEENMDGGGIVTLVGKLEPSRKATGHLKIKSVFLVEYY